MSSPLCPPPSEEPESLEAATDWGCGYLRLGSRSYSGEESSSIQRLGNIEVKLPRSSPGASRRWLDRCRRLNCYCSLAVGHVLLGHDEESGREIVRFVKQHGAGLNVRFPPIADISAFGCLAARHSQSVGVEGPSEPA